MTTLTGTPAESAVTPPAPMLVLDHKSNGCAIGERATAPPSTIAGDLMPVVLGCDTAAAPVPGSLAGTPAPITIELHGARMHVAIAPIFRGLSSALSPV